MKKLFVVSWLAALLCMAAVAGEKSSAYAAHEWGTFTSVQGADGAQLEWNPYVVAELPEFVYDRGRPRAEKNQMPIAALAGKISMVARQRMETPVIYFYAPEEKKVDVRVDFPSGMITEWYPQAVISKPFLDKGKFIDWKDVRIVPGAPDQPLKREKNASHYYAARDTKAAMLSLNSGKGAEWEKFLFYRGIASFEAPLKVTQQENGKRLTIRNDGKFDLRHLVVLGGIAQAKGEEPKLLSKTIDRLAPGESRAFTVEPGTWARSSKKDLKAEMEAALTREGLYPAEAAAMVNTWEDSWLEDGVRVLYLLPKAWTDEILPLRISPAPQEVARVMVGRAEIITPRMEQLVDAAIRDFARGEPAIGEMAIGRAKGFPFSRFNDAIVRSLLKKNRDKDYSKAAGELMIRVSQLRDDQKVAQN